MINLKNLNIYLCVWMYEPRCHVKPCPMLGLIGEIISRISINTFHLNYAMKLLCSCAWHKCTLLIAMAWKYTQVRYISTTTFGGKTWPVNCLKLRTGNQQSSNRLRPGVRRARSWERGTSKYSLRTKRFCKATTLQLVLAVHICNLLCPFVYKCSKHTGMFVHLLHL